MTIAAEASPADVIATASRLLQSRVGREMQRYDGATRLLACVVVLRKRKRADGGGGGGDGAVSACETGSSDSEAEDIDNEARNEQQQRHDDDDAEVLIISSSKHPDEWILPKGGWESDETLIECALREAEEEAGIAGEVVRELGALDFTSKNGKRCRFYGFQLAVQQEYDTWAESNRQRQWVSLADARMHLRRRPELLTMLDLTQVRKR